MKHPETGELAQAAFTKARAADPRIKTREDFAARLCIGQRTAYRWLAGDMPASDIGLMVLREVAAGWLPKVKG